VGPWEVALGDSIARLPPALREYFTTIPAGSVGRGSGVFSVVGTPRRWLWPILGILGREGIVFPVWEQDVPFTVENRPVYSGLASTRTFRFARGTRSMTDLVVTGRSGLEDRLGRHRWVVARLETIVGDDTLTLRSTGVRVLGVPLPPFVSPVVTVLERAHGGERHVSLTLDAPLIGRLYEYSGTFTYRIEPQGAHQ
jgi:hypothetical protein